MMESIVAAILGGALIGLAASLLLVAQGRVAGISGVLGGLLESPSQETSWRLSFVSGLLGGGIVLAYFAASSIVAPMGRNLLDLALAGLLVGYGTRLGSGCTSGHGVCGLTRFSRRSLVATLTFMAAGFVTATLIGAIS